MKVSITTLKEMIKDELSRFILTEDRGKNDAYPGELDIGIPTGPPAETVEDVEAEEQETTSHMHPDDPTDPAVAQKQKALRRTQSLEDKERFRLATDE